MAIDPEPTAKRFPAVLFGDPWTTGAISRSVSSHLGRRWRPAEVTDMSSLASHEAFLIADSRFAVFAKRATGDSASARLRSEADALGFLARTGGLRTPEVIGVLEPPRAADSAILVLEGFRALPRSPERWREIGRALARLHAVGSSRFGRNVDGYWGDFVQRNTPLADWPEFFWTRRVEPHLREVLARVDLPSPVTRSITLVESRLEELVGPDIQPSLLHGDAHVNNVVSTHDGPVFVDPAPYFGHPEMDLAYVDFFNDASDELLAGYAELTPIDDGFASRRELWRLPARLAMVEAAGPGCVVDLALSLATILGQT